MKFSPVSSSPVTFDADHVLFHHRSCQDFALFGHTNFLDGSPDQHCNHFSLRNPYNDTTYPSNTMPGPSNTLLIEGSFSELAEELASYVDNVAKSEEGAGLRSQIESSLATVRDSEQAPEPQSTDDAKVQAAKDDLLKKIVTKSSVLNSAPEKGMYFVFGARFDLTSSRVHRSLQSPHFPLIAILDTRSALCETMSISTATHHFSPPARSLSGDRNTVHNLQRPASTVDFALPHLPCHPQSYQNSLLSRIIRRPHSSTGDQRPRLVEPLAIRRR